MIHMTMATRLDPVEMQVAIAESSVPALSIRLSTFIMKEMTGHDMAGGFMGTTK